MYEPAVIPQNAAAGQIYAPKRSFVPLASANFSRLQLAKYINPKSLCFLPFSCSISPVIPSTTKNVI